jgi:hypothetical protein
MRWEECRRRTQPPAFRSAPPRRPTIWEHGLACWSPPRSSGLCSSSSSIRSSGTSAATPWGLLALAVLSHYAPEGAITGVIYTDHLWHRVILTFCALFAAWVAPVFATVVLGPDRRRSARRISFRPQQARGSRPEAARQLQNGNPPTASPYEQDYSDSSHRRPPGTGRAGGYRIAPSRHAAGLQRNGSGSRIHLSAPLKPSRESLPIQGLPQPMA